MPDRLPFPIVAAMRAWALTGPRGFMRGCLGSLLSLLLLPLPALASRGAEVQQEIRFGVLGLFHPKELAIEQAGGQVLSIAASGTAGARASYLTASRVIASWSSARRAVAS